VKPKTFYFILLAGIGGASLAGLMAYVWASNNLAASSRSLQHKLTESAVADERLDQLNRLRVQFKELGPVATKVESALPHTKKQSEIILQIQQIAAGSGMTIPAASFLGSNGLPTETSQTVKLGDYYAMPITFQLSGNYSQLQTFLQRLESLTRYTSVTSLAISRTDARNLTFTINLNAFFKP
jgi:Tfp pilus assembly protein PilO